MNEKDAQNSGNFTRQPVADAEDESTAAEPAAFLPLHPPDPQCPATGLGMILNDAYEAEYDGILLIIECHPQWSDKPLLKLDCPAMGYLSYKALPPAAIP